MQPPANKPVLVLPIAIVLSFLLYGSTTRFGFFSDDFVTLHRLGIEKKFWEPGFFRPLSDLVMLVNWRFSQLNASSYHIINILMHAFNCWLLYILVLRSRFAEPLFNQRLAIIASLLFLVYPFHAEPVTWIVGRGALMATSFALLVLLVYARKKTSVNKHLPACLLYLFALVCYESVMVLPLVVLILHFYFHRQLRSALMFSIPLFCMLLLNLVLRKLIAGVIVGNYGVDMFNENIPGYIFRYLKSVGRLFIPGTFNTRLFVILSISAFVLVLLSIILVRNTKKKYFSAYSTGWLLLLACQLVPGIFGIDTHNQDGDRMLYLPSIFLCLIIGFFLQVMLRKNKFLLPVLFVIVLAATFKTLSILDNWKQANHAVHAILNGLKKERATDSSIYIANVPELQNGCFVFRNGFKQALDFAGIDTNKVVVLNYLSRDDIQNAPAIILPEQNGAGFNVYPAVTLFEETIHIKNANDPGIQILTRPRSSSFVFWNKKELKKVETASITP